MRKCALVLLAFASACQFEAATSRCAVRAAWIETKPPAVVQTRIGRPAPIDQLEGMLVAGGVDRGRIAGEGRIESGTEGAVGCERATARARCAPSSPSAST